MRLALRLAPLILAASHVGLASAPTPIGVAVPTRKEPVSYAREVADILDAKCVGCHSAALAESKLNLEEISGMLKGGKRGPAIVPGKAADSLLFRLAAHRDEPVMPPKDKKDTKPLSPEELGLLQLWIDAGAKDDSAENAPPSRPIELGALPPGVQPIVAVDLNASGQRVAAGRGNVVQVYDLDSGLEINTLGGHKDIIQSIRFSPDGKTLAAGSYQIVTLWNVPDGGLAKTFNGHGDQVKALVVDPDGKTAYSGSPDRTVRAWSIADGTQLRQLNTPGPVSAMALSPDGKTLATGGQDNQVHLLNLADGRHKASLKGHTGQVNGLAFLADGRHLVSVSADGTGRIWTLPSDEVFQKTPNPNDVKVADPLVLSGHKGGVQALAVAPDRRTILTGGDDATVWLWHAADGKGSRILEASGGAIHCLAIDPTGKVLAAGSADKAARLIDLESGRPLRTLTGHAGPVLSVAFSPRGDQVVTAGADGGLKVWEAANGRGVIAFGHTAPNNGPIQPIQKVAFAGDGRLLSASADRTLKSWTFQGTWASLSTLGPHAFRVLALDFSPDGKLLAAGGGEPSRSGEIKIWDVAGSSLRRSIDTLHSDTVFGLRFSPDGTRLASAAADKFLKVSQVADGKPLKSFEGHTHHVLAVDWKSDGKQLVTGGGDNVLKVWDYDAGEQLRTLQAAGKQVTSVRWIPGKPEVAGASGDNQVRFWNPDNGGIARNFGGATDYVFGLATSSDGKRVVAGGADSILFYWNGENGALIRKLEPPPTPAARTAAVRP